MDLGMNDRVAIVTGGSRGFGKAVASQLAAEGAHVALCARSRADLEAAAAEIDTAGPGRVLARAVDVTDDRAMTDFVGDAARELGPCELCLVNGGGPPAAGFGDLDLADWEAAYRLILESAVRLCRLVLPGMMDRGYGRIVQITSIAVKQPVENLILSNVIRPAVHALTKNLALEAASHGVTVNSVAPGFHLTSAVERLIVKKMEQLDISREEVVSGWEKEIPAGRLGSAEELASLVLFLMSERAGYVTGQCIAADGGWIRGVWA